ncbi:response regulator [Pseudothauera lacus]|uniref:Response regulator n=2 Tax=Pseudothauera lacus TaxID=2136175 RepID=A0A2T4IHA8_9RHOO|nr:response regulator [Pseudothauera lacus]
MTLRAMLRHAGLEVVGEAPSAEQGLELVRRHQPEVVCIDVVLPGMDGIAALGVLRGEFPALTAVAVTGQSDRDTVTRLISQGADGVVVKPFSAARLIEEIGRARGLRAGRRAAEGEVK